MIILCAKNFFLKLVTEIKGFLLLMGKYVVQFQEFLKKVIDNKTTNADHMISKFSKNENLDEFYDK